MNHLLALITIIIAIAAIVVNFLINQKNRKTNNAFQLSRDYFHDKEFVEMRLVLWVELKDLKNEEHNLESILKNINNENPPLSKQSIVALNRVSAFFSTLNSLEKENEVNLKVLKKSFGYNYLEYWNKHREQFEKYSNNKDLFEKTPFFHT